MRTVSRGRISHIAGEQRVCNLWNAAYPEGSDVILKLDDGSEQRTKTRSQAWVMGNHTAVIALEGRAGGYRLDRVRPA